MSILGDIQQYDPGGIVELFELDLTALGGALLRFHNGVSVLQNDVVWQGNTYTRFPIQASGFEYTGKGVLPRPKLVAANAGGVLQVYIALYNDLIGAKLTRHRTLVKYLDRENFTVPAGTSRATSSIKLNNLNTYAEVQDIVNLKYTGQDFSVEGWYTIDASDSNQSYLFSKAWNGNGDYNYNLVKSAGNTLSIQVAGTTNFVTGASPVLTTGVAHHVVMVLKSDKSVLLYVDNVLVISQTHAITGWTPASAVPDQNLPLAVGTLFPYGDAWAGVSTFTLGGAVEDFRVYARALSAAEVSSHYSGVFTDESGLLVFVPFDEGTGTVAADFSGNGNNATLRNSVPWSTDLNLNKLRLSTTASAVNDYYKNMSVQLIADSRTRTVVSYNGASKIAYLNKPWATNLVINSDNLAGTGWVATGCTAVANQAIGPNGLLTAARITPNGGVSSYMAQNPGGGIAGRRYAWVVYAKTDVSSTLIFEWHAATWLEGAATTYNLSNGTFTGGLAGDVITPLGGGWYRCAGVRTAIGAPLSNALFIDVYPLGVAGRSVFIARAVLALSDVVPDVADDLLTGATAILPPVAVSYQGVLPSNVTPDTTAAFADDIYFLDRKSQETKTGIEYELSSALDVAGATLPNRQVIQNTCPWKYRGGECGFAGGAIADAYDVATTILANDQCGKRLSSCKLRFGSNAQLPYGGFPSAGLTHP